MDNRTLVGVSTGYARDRGGRGPVGLDGGRPGDQGEGLLGGDGGHQGVSGEGGEIVEKGSEAVDWEAVLGSASSLLGNGGARAPGFSDDAGALRFGGILVGVVVEQSRQALAHM